MRQKIWIALVLSTFFLVGANIAQSAQIDNELQGLIGTWKGEDFTSEKTLLGQCSLQIKSFLGNKFLAIDLTRKPLHPTDQYQARGYLTTDQEKYYLYWFDTDGFHGRYEGEVKGNSLLFEDHDPGAGDRTVTLTLNTNKLEVLVGAGGRAAQTMTYEKSH